MENETDGHISVRPANCPFLEERGPGPQLSSFSITRVSTLGKWHLKELPFGKGKESRHRKFSAHKSNPLIGFKGKPLISFL